MKLEGGLLLVLKRAVRDVALPDWVASRMHIALCANPLRAAIAVGNHAFHLFKDVLLARHKQRLKPAGLIFKIVR